MDMEVLVASWGPGVFIFVSRAPMEVEGGPLEPKEESQELGALMVAGASERPPEIKIVVPSHEVVVAKLRQAIHDEGMASRREGSMDDVTVVDSQIEGGYEY